jgi:hypothetical protein
MIDFEDIEYKRLDDETEDDYILRICGLKEDKRLLWDEIARIINKELELNYSESRYRKLYSAYKKGKADVVKEEEIPEISEYMQQKIELQKERVKISDERIQTNAYIRQIAREETIKEIASKCAQEMNSKKLLEITKDKNLYFDKNNSAIVCLSDWHYGIDIKNYWNVYNPDIAKERVSKLRDEVRRRCIENNVKDLHVVNLADLIAGRIHLGLRLESRFDVITQVMQVSEILVELLNDWADDFEIHYYDCLDNHSRLEPNKKDAMDLESLARVIPWYLKERLNNRIVIHENEYDEGIITFRCHGYEVVGVHGDHDKPSSVVDNMSLMTHKHYDLVVTAHLHHFSADEKNETVVVSNGSLMGTDTYAKNLRLSSKASQNLIIVTNNSPCECIYRIILN